MLSTLHTNDAPSAVVRLMDLGVPHYLIRGSLSGIVAQRLVRTLCPKCKREQPLEAADWAMLVDGRPLPPPEHPFTAVGCDDCRSTGYQGRVAIYEMLDTLFYSPSDVSRTAPHVRDGVDLKRVMIYVWLAVFPCTLMACWNTGYQANLAMQAMGLDAVPGWRGAILGFFGVGVDPSSIWDSFWYFAPIYFVTFVAGISWEVLFAAVRKHEINEGFFVTSILFALIVPPTTPLWQAALGISFGVVIAKEVFGGTGKNFVNPALAGRAFLFFAYPAEMSGDAVWTAVDGFSGATPLALAAEGGTSAILAAGYRARWVRDRPWPACLARRFCCTRKWPPGASWPA